MATEIELRSQQKRMLYSLMKIRQDNPDLDIKGLNEQIKAFQAEMEQADVALVEKMVSDTDFR